MMRLLAAIDRRAATSAWTRLTLQRRAAWSVLLSLEAGVLLLVPAAFIGGTGAWIPFVIAWGLACLFFGGMAANPEVTPHVAVRVLLAAFAVFAVGFPLVLFIGKV